MVACLRQAARPPSKSSLASDMALGVGAPCRVSRCMGTSMICSPGPHSSVVTEGGPQWSVLDVPDRLWKRLAAGTATQTSATLRDLQSSSC